jgi:hypothetical protein
VSGAIARWAGAPWPWGCGAAIAATFIAPACFNDGWLDNGVWFWNGAVRRINAWLRRYVIAVAYYGLIVPLGWIGVPGAAADADGRRHWRPVDASGRHRTDAGTRHDLAAFCRTSGHAWALCLMPVISLLLVLREEQQESAPSSSTYTLY